MLRNVFIILVLASLAATLAAASPVIPATAHKRASHLSAHPRAVHRSAAGSGRHGSSPSAAYLAGYRAGHSSRPLKHRSRTAAAPSRASRAAESNLRAVAKPASLQRSRLVRGPHEPVLVRGVGGMPPPLKGSFESLARQNERAEADGLERILDEADLASRIEQKLLVPVPASGSLAVNANLPENHRYCRPWTANFLGDLARTHAAQFHRPIEVSSAVRTVEYQQQLMMINGNAAAAEGDIVSPHLTGGTVDVVKQGMTRQELGWMRNWLLARQLAGTIDVEEEFRQSCFHITVYRNYTSAPPPTPAQKLRRRHPGAATQIASRGK